MKAVKSINTMVLASMLAVMLALPGTRASAEVPHDFSQAELDQMLAPIALYPDTVLSHVLIAATYPLEVVQAARWSRANPGYEGEYAVEAVEHMPWDPSVMALVAFPELLSRMDADLEWTRRLGDAFLIQEYEVLDTIQYLRDEAYASGHLRSNEYVRVVREREYIYIEPAVTRVVYVPYYDPRRVYASWRWSSYPPVYWDHPRAYSSGVSFYWGSGYRVQSAFYFSSFHWSSYRVVVHDHYRYGHRKGHKYAGKNHYRFSSGREVAQHEGSRHWTHDSRHRQGVAYRRGIDERHQLKAERTTSSRAVQARAGSSSGSQPSHSRSRDRREMLQTRSRTPATQSQPPAISSSSNRISAAETRRGNAVLDARATADELRSRSPGGGERQSTRIRQQAPSSRNESAQSSRQARQSFRQSTRAPSPQSSPQSSGQSAPNRAGRGTDAGDRRSISSRKDQASRSASAATSRAAITSSADRREPAGRAGTNRASAGRPAASGSSISRAGNQSPASRAFAPRNGGGGSQSRREASRPATAPGRSASTTRASRPAATRKTPSGRAEAIRSQRGSSNPRVGRGDTGNRSRARSGEVR